MIILFGDYLDLNHHHPYEWGKPEHVSQQESDELRPYWELFEQGKLNLKKGRITREEWESNVWIDVLNSWFTENGYTTYCLLKPSTRPPEYIWQEKESKWIDRKNGVVVTESFESRIGFTPRHFDDYIDKMREYELKEYKRLTAHDFKNTKVNEQVHSSAYDTCQRWLNKTEARWFHEL